MQETNETFFLDKDCPFNSDHSVIHQAQVFSILLFNYVSAEYSVVCSHGNCDPALNPGGVSDWRVALPSGAVKGRALEACDDKTGGMSFHNWIVCYAKSMQGCIKYIT